MIGDKGNYAVMGLKKASAICHLKEINEAPKM